MLALGMILLGALIFYLMFNRFSSSIIYKPDKENKNDILLIISIIVFGYLFYALIKPEKF